MTLFQTVQIRVAPIAVRPWRNIFQIHVKAEMPKQGYMLYRK